MKKLTYLFLALLMILTTFSMNAQDPLKFSEVIIVDGNPSKSELYMRARTWFATIYVDSQEVIQFDDKDFGKVIGKGAILYNSSVFVGSDCTKGVIRYKLSIQVKEGRYKYEIANFIHEGNTLNCGDYSFGLITKALECPYKIRGGGKKWNNKVWIDIKKGVEIEGQLLAESLKKAMNKVSEESNDDW